MREKLLDLIQDETGITCVGEATPLEDLGMDSLEFRDLLELIRKKIGAVDTGKATEANTVGELMAAVQMCLSLPSRSGAIALLKSGPSLTCSGRM